MNGEGQFIFGSISSGGLAGLRETAYQFASLFSLVACKPQPRLLHQKSQPRKRGKKPGGVKDIIFQDFAFDLYNSTTTVGGKLTLEKNGRFGTFVDAIRLLVPHLPPILCRNLCPSLLFNG